MQFLKFNNKAKQIMKIDFVSYQDNKNHEILKIQFQNTENHENLIISLQNHENHDF